ncbi:ent-kaurenoic acid oxidase 1-like isoform X1 [Tasmannia lanceolata]|uniref:ent-kaurenoic acid oxidase 1-like isoform X1 n=1 Tax=Tasmannia lanceolata TaxID=3420 RepID=UPI004063B3EA
MEGVFAWWSALALGLFPIVVWLLWWWNEIWFLAPVKASLNGSKIPPGHMGLPFIGEMLNFLWYFKIVKRPDDFIKSRRQRYGEGVGMYRSHLFGSPSIIACSPAINKFILQSSDLFTIKWPSTEIIGANSVVSVNGESHTRIRSFILNAINKPEALKRITLVVQPGITSSLRSWAEKGTIVADDETKKVTFENICNMFVSYKPGPLLNELDKCFRGVVKGVRAQPFNFPGTAYHHALRCRRKLGAVFRAELEKRKQGGDSASVERNDLMDGLMQIKDEEGNQLGDEEVVDNITSLIIAGYESTGMATMWSLYYLSKSPDVLRRLREEHMEISIQKKGAFITMEDIKKMKYTPKVVEETVRMANIAPVIFRRVNKDVDYRGYRIPKDWKVAVWLRHLHTDPNNFEDPFTFNPDRWNEPAKPGTYQVFGGGPRICAGNMLVRIQLSIFLHHLTIGYRWELINPDAKIRYLPHPRPVDGAKMAFHAI